MGSNPTKAYRANVINKLIDMGIKPNKDAPTESLERVLRAAIENKEKFGEPKAAGGPVKKKKQIGGPIGTNEKQPLEQGALGQMYKGGGKIKKKKKTKKKMGHGGKMKKMYAKGGGIRKPTMGVN